MHPVSVSYYNDLDASLAHAWQQLEDAVSDRRHGFHDVQVATVATDGSPQVRTVVLRDADAALRQIRFHTDRRSPKCKEIRDQPRIALHAYDARRKLQLRLAGLARLHDDDAVAEDAWQRAHAMSRMCYRVAPGPGTVISSPDSAAHPAVADAEAGREHFTAVVVTVDVMEWLYLAAEGHRRARWRQRGGVWQGQWLVP